MNVFRSPAEPSTTGPAAGRGRRITTTTIVGTTVVATVVGSAVAGLATADPDPAPAASGPCHNVGYVGDSTSVGMTDPAIIPDANQRLDKQLATIAGVTHASIDSAVGRAVVEQVADASPGLTALTTISQQTPAPDCYIVALGTNDAVMEASGSSVKAADRISRVMAIAAGRPVLWPTVKTTAAATATNQYASPEAMQDFDTALQAAKAQYPNLTVFDWAAEASDDLFAGDGIHYTAAGTERRITRFAEALRDIPAAGTSGAPPAAPATSNVPDPGTQALESALSALPTSTPAAQSTEPTQPATVTSTVTTTVTATTTTTATATATTTLTQTVTPSAAPSVVPTAP